MLCGNVVVSPMSWAVLIGRTIRMKSDKRNVGINVTPPAVGWGPQIIHIYDHICPDISIVLYTLMETLA